ncbi:MAG: hypothetical protein LBW85_05675 [Deltaproteobacteria bacterium]|jgi:hypothetical protein|nr:hypothetical protein [Deltaproteobacteria bacterium]
MTFKTPICFLGFLGICGILAALAPALLAQAGGGEAAMPPKPAASADSEAVAALSLAARAAEEGRKSGSPFALAAAAEILSSVQVTDTGRLKESESEGSGGPSPEPPASAGAASRLDAAALYAEAAAAARKVSDEHLAESISQAAAAAGTRQPASGHGGRHRDRVNPNTTDIYTVRYNGNELARTTVVAEENADLDLYVYDSAGALVAYDNDPTGIGICVWMPQRTDDFRIRVKNMTGGFVHYLIFTN